VHGDVGEQLAGPEPREVGEAGGFVVVVEEVGELVRDDEVGEAFAQLGRVPVDGREALSSGGG
jgi:hypothetical protein